MALVVTRIEVHEDGRLVMLRRDEGQGGRFVCGSGGTHGVSSATGRDQCTAAVLAKLSPALPSDRRFVRDAVFRMFDVEEDRP